MSPSPLCKPGGVGTRTVTARPTMTHMIRQAFIATAVVSLALTLTSCTGSGIPTATGDADNTPAIVAQVDCGDDGLANVSATYGTGEEKKVFIGDSPHADADKFDKNYGTLPGYSESMLTIATSPIRGTCLTRLTDRNSGEVLDESETAGEATLTALVPAVE